VGNIQDGQISITIGNGQGAETLALQVRSYSGGGRMKGFALCLGIVLILTGQVLGGDKPSFTPSTSDRCPVCGMYVAKYREFLAQIVFKDGSYVVFDGAKDMFKYYLNMSKYEKNRQAPDIDSVYVTDYYNVVLVNALKAYFVKGSNVYGPMGKELIVFENEESAKEFMIDHSGDSILRFDDVTLDIIRQLD
jgi:copper chaperone NosL